MSSMLISVIIFIFMVSMHPTQSHPKLNVPLIFEPLIYCSRQVAHQLGYPLGIAHNFILLSNDSNNFFNCMPNIAFFCNGYSLRIINYSQCGAECQVSYTVYNRGRNYHQEEHGNVVKILRKDEFIKIMIRC